MIRVAQELAFEIATEDNPEVLESPIVQKARELVKYLKQLIEVQKEVIKSSSSEASRM